MVDSRLIPIPGSERESVPGARLLGPVAQNERLEVTVVLKPRAAHELASLLERTNSNPVRNRRYVARADFTDRFGAENGAFNRVEAWARESDVFSVFRSRARRTMVLSGTARRFQRLFQVELNQHDDPMLGTFRGRTGPVYIPSELEGVIEGVFGLDNRPAAKPHMRRADDAVMRSAASISFMPPEVGQLYNFPGDPTGDGQCIGIIELGGGFRTADIQAYFQQLGIDAPEVVAVSVDHATNSPGGPNGPDGEVMLDIEVAGSIAPGASIAVYFAPNSNQGFIDAVTTAIHDDVNKPSIISISWGQAEHRWTRSAMQSMDQAFQAAGVLGISVFCASGDSGSSDGVRGRNVDFPASSPNVTGCGGTRITALGGSITSEVVWNDPGDGAGGGGQSSVFGLPSWQTRAVSTQNPAFRNRGVPDVAGDASPASGYVVRVDGQTGVIGGTSAVAPLWAGLTALLNESLGTPIGAINPIAYGLSSSTGSFHDITQGSNGAYRAAAGWDACTGLGSPDGGKLLAALGGSNEVNEAQDEGSPEDVKSPDSTSSATKDDD